MSDAYTALEKKIEALPENCLAEVSTFVDFIFFRTGIDNSEKGNKLDNADNSIRMDAINEAFGLWADHDNSLSVDATVRQMRRGRSFDI